MKNKSLYALKKPSVFKKDLDFRHILSNLLIKCWNDK